MPVAKRNLLQGLPDQLAEERFEPLLERRGVRLERILSLGHVTEPDRWYDQQLDEWVLLLAGGARLEFDDGRQETLVPGDAVLLPARCRHRVVWTDPGETTVWLALHLVPEHAEENDDEE